MATALPLSMFLMSVSTILIGINWLVWGNFKAKFQRFFSNKSAWIFTLIFLMHILGGLYSTDFKFYFDDLRIKLPLLVYPIVLGASPSLSRKQGHTVMWVFSAALLTSSLISEVIYLGWTSIRVENFRDISPFISHIRLSLLTCVCCVWLFLAAIKAPQIWCKLACALGIIWLAYFLNILQSITGFGILAILIVLFAVGKAWKIDNPIIKWAVLLSFVGLPPAYVTIKAIQYTSSKDVIDVSKLDSLTENGRAYEHVPTRLLTENGHRVFLYSCYDEIEKEWPRRSKVPIDSVLPNGGEIEAVLIRYLTSKNLRKDSIGVWSLSYTDIAAIEAGQSNYLYTDNGMQKRLYGVFQEMDSYKYGEVNGHSSTQRFEYLKTGWHISKQNFWFGVGTGDLKMAFDQQYEIDKSPLLPEFRLRAHNQYLSILIGFGLIGFIGFLACLFSPVILNKTYKNRIFIGFLVIALISFLSEDTLETQAGASFFIFFYGLFVWAWAKKID